MCCCYEDVSQCIEEQSEQHIIALFLKADCGILVLLWRMSVNCISYKQSLDICSFHWHASILFYFSQGIWVNPLHPCHKLIFYRKLTEVSKRNEYRITSKSNQTFATINCIQDTYQIKDWPLRQPHMVANLLLEEFCRPFGQLSPACPWIQTFSEAPPLPTWNL
jgi:hypothetical protein